MMRFSKVIIIGSGKIACDCAMILREKSIEFDVIETKNSKFSTLKAICRKNEIKYDAITDYKLLEMELSCRLNLIENTLLISANNAYIFPESITDAEHVTIINFHYSYLPDYRGVNIPSWVIYNEEQYTGVTWHYVNSNIDDGNILIQRKITLEGLESAFDIVKKGMQLGKESFCELIEILLFNDIKGQENNINAPHKYTKKDIPDNGVLDVTKPANYIIKMLRAFDYNGIAIFPKLKLILDGMNYEICKYRVERDGNVIIKSIGNWNADYTINKGDVKILLKLDPA